MTRSSFLRSLATFPASDDPIAGIIDRMRDSASLTASDLKDDLLDFVLRHPAILESFRREEAERRGVPVEEVDAAIESWKREHGQTNGHNAVAVSVSRQ